MSVASASDEKIVSFDRPHVEIGAGSGVRVRVRVATLHRIEPGSEFGYPVKIVVSVGVGEADHATGFGEEFEARLERGHLAWHKTGAVVGDEFVVGIRNSHKDCWNPLPVIADPHERSPVNRYNSPYQSKVNDPDYRWPGGEAEAETIFSALSEAGVDYLHVTEEDISTPAFDSRPTLAELAARYGDAPVIADGGLTEPAVARDVIETNGIELITLATGALANPDWPNRVTNGQEIEGFDPEAFLDPDASIDEFEVPE